MVARSIAVAATSHLLAANFHAKISAIKSWEALVLRIKLVWISGSLTLVLKNARLLLLTTKYGTRKSQGESQESEQKESGSEDLYLRMQLLPEQVTEDRDR